MDNTIIQLYLTYIYIYAYIYTHTQVHYITSIEYTFFSNVYRKFSRVDCMLSHKINLNKLKKTEIAQIIFSNNNTVELESLMAQMIRKVKNMTTILGDLG